MSSTSVTPLTRRLVTGVAGALLLLVTLEGLVRLLGIAPPVPKMYRDPIYVPDPYLPYHQKPGISGNVPAGTGEFREIFTHNTAGFRDVEHPRAKPAGTFRILGVGASITYGSGTPFEQTYLYLLEQYLNAAPSPTQRVEIVKAGVGGFFPAPQHLLVEHYGLDYAPDLLLVSFDATDLSETFIGMDEMTVYDGPLKTTEMHELGRLRTALAVHTHVGRILFKTWSRHRRKRLMANYRPADPAVWDAIEQEFAAMQRLMTARGGRMAVCHIPLPDDPPIDLAGELQTRCARHGIPVIDTTPFLKRAAAQDALYWEMDGHCTPAAHAAIADALREGLRHAELVPGPTTNETGATSS
jgi:hypothetical protein